MPERDSADSAGKKVASGWVLVLGDHQFALPTPARIAEGSFILSPELQSLVQIRTDIQDQLAQYSMSNHIEKNDTDVLAHIFYPHEVH